MYRLRRKAGSRIAGVALMGLALGCGDAEGPTGDPVSDEARLLQLLEPLDEELRDEIFHDDPEVRWGAVSQVRDHLPPGDALTALELLYARDGNGDVRKELIDEVARVGGPRAVGLLEQVALSRDEPNVREHALYLLGSDENYKLVNLERMRELLWKPKGNPELQFDALRLLLKDRSTEEVHSILKKVAATHPHPDVREVAVGTMRAHISADLLPFLRQRLDEEEAKFVRDTIQHTIKTIEKADGATSV